MHAPSPLSLAPCAPLIPPCPRGPLLALRHPRTPLPSFRVVRPVLCNSERAGAGTLERPSVAFVTSFAPIYRVILHYTNWDDPKPVAKRIMKCVPHLSFGDGMRIAKNAALYNTSVVVTVPLDEAKIYETRLTRSGLRVTLDMA